MTEFCETRGEICFSHAGHIKNEYVQRIVGIERKEADRNNPRVARNGTQKWLVL